MSVELDDKTKTIFDSIKELTFLQTANLVKAFEDEFGISAAAAPVAVAGGGGAAAGGGEAEEKTYDVVLKDAGASKINVLKEVRAVTGLGLKEAKELVDSAPKAIKEGLEEAEAKEIKEKLEAAGATVELK
jgi:large subunit ribosomal protein L7/L12